MHAPLKTISIEIAALLVTVLIQSAGALYWAGNISANLKNVNETLKSDRDMTVNELKSNRLYFESEMLRIRTDMTDLSERVNLIAMKQVERTEWIKRLESDLEKDRLSQK